MSLTLNKASEAKLKGVHPDLIRVVRRMCADWKDPQLGLIVTCGPRSLEEQQLLVKKGASRTLKSRHIPGKDGYAKAVDFAITLNGALRWDWPLYDKLAKAMKTAAQREKVPLEWGGDWTFKDGPHFQLPRAQYP